MDQPRSVELPDRFISIHEIAALVSVSEPTIWRYVALGDFPAPFCFGVQTRRWRQSEVISWIEAHPRGVCRRKISTANE